MTFLIIKLCDIYLWIQSYTYPDEPGPASNENTAFSINHSVYLWTVWIHQVSSINVYHTNIFSPILKLSPSLTAIENFLSKHTKKPHLDEGHPRNIAACCQMDLRIQRIILKYFHLGALWDITSSPSWISDWLKKCIGQDHQMSIHA